MTFDQNQYSAAANLLGNVEIPRNIRPMIRSGLRRSNPDLTSASPYYPDANGRTLRISYTKEVSTVVTEDSVDIVLTGDSLATIIDDINAADSVNLDALDLDGFLTIRNLNPGKTHFLSILAFDTPGDDAASVLGFPVFPFPGGTSFAGEFAAAPGTRTQSNPQTTALLAKDDTLGGAELNRGMFAILQMVENLRAELSRDVVVYKNLRLSFAQHAVGSEMVANVDDDDIRLFYPEVDPPSTVPDLNGFYRVLGVDGSEEIVSNSTPTGVYVQSLHYATDATVLVTGTVFTTWGTPDGRTIVSNTTVNKTKHAATNITNIKGNIVECAAATFVTLKVKAGDPVQLVATNLQPFDHSGWFAVDAVIDETHLAIRPMAVSEQTPVADAPKPRWLNPTAAGTLRVAMGRFVPAGNIFISIGTSIPEERIIRAPVGVPFINTLTDERALGFAGTLNKLSIVLSNHLNAASDAHAATAIGGFTSTATWRDATSITGADLRLTIENILTDLAAQATGNSGTGRIGAESISIGGSSPNTVAQGTVLSQLTSILTSLRDHVNLSSGAHAASAISYAGGPAWANGITNPATTVEAQLDKIVTDLAASGTVGQPSGWSKIGTNSDLPNWANGQPGPNSSTISGVIGNLVTNLVSPLGSDLLGSEAIPFPSGSDLLAGTIYEQLVVLASGWLKMTRVNTITAAQTFSALITANGGLTSAGLISALNGLLLGTNENVKLVGTGRYGHDDMVLPLPAMHFSPRTGTFVTTGLLTHWETSGAASLTGPLNLPEGTRIRSFTTWARKNGNANAFAVSLTRVSLNLVDFTDTHSGVGSSSDTSSGFNLSTSSSAALNHVIDPAFVYFFTVDFPVAGIHFIGIQVTFDYPVTVP